MTTAAKVLQIARDEFRVENGRDPRDAELVQVLARWLSQIVRIPDRLNAPLQSRLGTPEGQNPHKL